MTKTNRRSALGLFVANPAAMAAFATGKALAAPPADLDATLFALEGEIDAADREFEKTFDAFSFAERKALNHLARPVPPEMDAASCEAMAEFKARMDAIRAQGRTTEQIAYEEAMSRRQTNKGRLRIECDLAAAEGANTTAMSTVTALRDRIVGAPAKTLAGLIFKAKYAVAHYPGEYDQDVMDSVIDDLLALGREV